MLLSIVTGTYNRLSYLARMVASVRSQIPRHIQYELVIVDGGSTDGTLEWCKLQPDIHLIEHGELKGAIKAFCDGARAAIGTYTVLANDDIEFHPYSLMRAIAYLEDHRTCGAVAFADNRSQQTGRAKGHQVEGQPAIGLNGNPSWVVYGQVAMYRRWLGDQVGWWGDNDPVMGQARTYGGDNWLASRIWELGYSIDPVDGCAIDDLLPRDGLRARNNETGERDSRLYYQAYPRGPQLRAEPAIPNRQHESLRVIVCDIHDPHIPARTAKEYGLAEAFAKVALTWHFDIANEPFDLPKAALAWQPHLIFLQIHGPEPITAHIISRTRAMCPNAVVVSWCGDAHDRCLVAPEVIDILHYVDLQLVVNAKVLPTYAQLGIKADYWQIAYKEPAQPYDGEVLRHDILWQGNAYDDRRIELVTFLQSLPYDIGTYGNCPNTLGNTHYDFARQAALYANAKIVISDTFPDTEGFVSNRLFQALGAGAFVLQQHSPRLDDLTGLRAGEHYIEWHDLEDLQRLIAEWITPECTEMRKAIAEQGKGFVRANYTYDAQLKKLWALLP